MAEIATLLKAFSEKWRATSKRLIEISHSAKDPAISQQIQTAAEELAEGAEIVAIIMRELEEEHEVDRRK